MNLKYYLRGLGIGILVTAVIVGIASKNDRIPMSDEEIKKRAQELGMIENVVLTDMDNASADPSSVPAASADARPSGKDTEETLQPADNTGQGEGEVQPAGDDGKAEEGIEPSPGDTGENEENGDAASSAVPSKAPETSGMGLPAEDIKEEEEETRDSDGAQGEKIEFSIKSGDGSYVVSKKLEERGLISSASEYDTFLCSNNYDKKIRVGNYEIPRGASEQEIAEIITGGPR